MKKIICSALSIAFSLCLYTPIQAQKAELREALRSYNEENVIPILQEKHAQFDEQLSTEDLNLITQLRAEAKVNRQDRRAKMKEMKALREQGKSREEIREMMKAHHQESKAERGNFKEDLKGFMQRNRELIKSSLKDLQPNYSEWTQAQKKIIYENWPEQTEGTAPKMKGPNARLGLFGLAPKPPRDKKHRRHMERENDDISGSLDENKGRGKKRKKGMIKMLAKSFVLWDGSMPPVPQTQKKEDIKSIPNVELGKLNRARLEQNFPNPAGEITTIPFILASPINTLTLTITQLDGKIVQTNAFEGFDKGAQQLDIDVSNLPEGQYIYTLTGEGLNASKQMTVKRN